MCKYRPGTRTVKLKVPPIQATTALRAGGGIALPNLRLRH